MTMKAIIIMVVRVLGAVSMKLRWPTHWNTTQKSLVNTCKSANGWLRVQTRWDLASFQRPWTIFQVVNGWSVAVFKIIRLRLSRRRLTFFWMDCLLETTTLVWILIVRSSIIPSSIQRHSLTSGEVCFSPLVWCRLLVSHIQEPVQLLIMPIRKR